MKLRISLILAFLVASIAGFFLLLPRLPKPAAPPKEPTDPIVLQEPANGSTVTSPLHLRGIARTFEQNVPWELRDARTNEVVLQGATTATAPDIGMFGPFAADIFLPKDTPSELAIIVYDSDAATGRTRFESRTEVRLETQGNLELQTFFLNPKRAAKNRECDQVFARPRTLHTTKNTAEAALKLLLAGPTPEEVRAGYQSQIPEGTTLRSVRIEDGIAITDFPKWLESGGGGSCRVTAIRKQIETTLRQFPTITSVVIEIEGRADGVLQP